MPVSLPSIISSLKNLLPAQQSAIKDYLQRTKIIDAEFVKLAVNFTNGTSIITRNFNFSTSYRAHTISGEIFSELGALVNITGTQRDISSSGYDTGITITGLDPKWIYVVAGAPATQPIDVTNQSPIPVGYYPLIKGSKAYIYRGFFDDNYNLVTSALRYTGIITSYTIAENRDSQFDALDDTYTINLQCSAYRQVLENRVSGRKTNSTSWKYVNNGDTSMDRVSGLEGKKFDFGKDPKK